MSCGNTVELLRVLSFKQVERALVDRSGRIDEIVRGAFGEFLTGTFPEGVAAVAVGGFGRRELFPWSDVDVLLLTREGLKRSALKEPLGRFLQSLWDAGMRISHSVHTVEECCQIYEHNVELSISLLDHRPLAGDSDLLDEFDVGVPRLQRLHGKSLARHLAKLTRFRHAKHQNTIYHLEPHLKESPGAIRDLQVVRWFAQLAAQGGASGLLSEAWQFFAPLRFVLHEHARRDDNLLSFEMQDAVSLHPEQLMRDYYRHARTVHAGVTAALDAAEGSQASLVRQIRDWRSRLSNSEFTVSRDQVFVRSPQLLASDADLVFRLMEFVGRHGLPASPEAIRRISGGVEQLAAAFRERRLWPVLKNVLSQPKASAAIRQMHASGLLGALLPEWARIDCMVVRDYYHRYTVDEHTIVAIGSIEDIEDGRFRELAGEIEEMALVRFALLLHDVGKGSGVEHTAESERLADEAGRRIGMPEDELATVRRLIANHLELSSTMNSRDMGDPATARALAARMGTVEFLKMLALLTYADISAVNPSAMTPWRSDQLWRAYVLAYEELTRELDTERIHDFDDTDLRTREFVEGLPSRYLRTHQLEEIHRHAALSGEASVRGAAVELTRQGGYWRAVVIAVDREFLFASMAGTLASFGMNILKAEAFSNARGLIMDTFTFADPLRTLELNPSEVDRLRDTMVRVILGKQDVRRLLSSRRPGQSARVRRAQPKVLFNNDASEAATLIEIAADDRPGLLYDLASTISAAGCNIVVVLVDTEAHRALDVFYVTAAGNKVAGELEESLRGDLLAVCGGV
jgi:[protein-PII] uridylyltransferase